VPHNKLTAPAVDTKSERGHYADGGGLVLQVSKWGTKSWIFRYQRDGRERHMGLGPTHTLSLAEARERARDCRKLLLDGRDPIEQRRTDRIQQRVEAERGITFKQCAESFVAANEAGWQNCKHRAQWTSTLDAYAYPIIGELPIARIDTALIVKCIEPFWKAKPETAKRVRGRIERVLDWAKVRGFRDGENPARWRGHLDKLLPSPRKVRAVKHHAAIPWREIPLFMAEVRARDELATRALEFTVLTALRTGEIIAAKWAEVDIAAKVWTIPAVRMKAKREHRVPLSRRGMEIIERLPRDGDYLFPGDPKDRPLSNRAMLRMLDRLKRADVTVHGFRSTFRDWAAESTAYPNHVVEMALAHTVGDKVEAAYRRGDLFEKRRRLMEDWAKYCGRSASNGANVVALGSRETL
jgi:integrase